MSGSISRREFLKGGAGFLGALAVLATNSGALLQRITGWNSSPAFLLPSSVRILERLKYDMLAQHLGEPFAVLRGTAYDQELKLTATTDLRHQVSSSNLQSDAGGAGEVYSLVFSGPTSRPLGQDTYTLQHNAIGEFPLFLVPIFPDEERAYYEAVIDRRHPV